MVYDILELNAYLFSDAVRAIMALLIAGACILLSSLLLHSAYWMVNRQVPGLKPGACGMSLLLCLLLFWPLYSLSEVPGSVPTMKLDGITAGSIRWAKAPPPSAPHQKPESAAEVLLNLADTCYYSHDGLFNKRSLYEASLGTPSAIERAQARIDASHNSRIAAILNPQSEAIRTVTNAELSTIRLCCEQLRTEIVRAHFAENNHLATLLCSHWGKLLLILIGVPLLAVMYAAFRDIKIIKPAPGLSPSQRVQDMLIAARAASAQTTTASRHAHSAQNLRQ